MPSAWLVLLGEHVRQGKYTVELPGEIDHWRDIAEGDGLLIAEDVDGEWRALKFASVFRVRGVGKKTMLYFDAVTAVEAEPPLDSLSITSDGKAGAERLDWPKFEGALRAATGEGVRGAWTPWTIRLTCAICCGWRWRTTCSARRTARTRRSWRWACATVTWWVSWPRVTPCRRS
ncbi:hypothetical protein CTI14_13110 [Methylobacterium radiotolerans]|nr:hypothetical protein CTI14_13110 [Methylobacterium radiotolerans]